MITKFQSCYCVTFMKRLDKSLRLDFSNKSPEFLLGYAFKLVGKNLSYGGPGSLVVNINNAVNIIVVGVCYCTRKC